MKSAEYLRLEALLCSAEDVLLSTDFIGGSAQQIHRELRELLAKTTAARIRSEHREQMQKLERATAILAVPNS